MTNEILKINNDAPEVVDNFKKAQEIMRANAIQLRQNKTLPDIIHTRDGKQGMTWRYVKRIAVMQWLDEHFPGWSFEVIPESFREYAGHVSAIGKLTVYEPETGLKRTIQCTGSDEIEFTKTDKKMPVTMTYHKNAETDALKRCVFSLGGFTDVYTDDDDVPESIVPDSDLDWFIKNVLKLLLRKLTDEKITARNLFKSITGFMYGEITKEKIYKAFPELTINNTIK